MAGALTISTLNNDTGVLASQNGMTGIAKAWANYNGISQTLNGSFNISSVTYNGVGDYTFNFTTAMPNTNYSVALSGGDNSNTLAPTVRTNTLSTTSCRIYSLNATQSGFQNNNPVFIAVFSS